MAYTTAISLHAAGSEAASSSGTAVDIGARTTVDLVLDVTAVTGSLTVVVETSEDGTSGWTEVTPHDADGADVEFAAATAAGVQRITFPDCKRYVRAAWTIVTGPATFSLTGASVLTYCSPADVADLALNGPWLARAASDKVDKATRAATGQINSAYTVRGLDLPPTAWGDDTRDCCAVISSISVLSSEGIKPQEQDEWLWNRYQLCLEWLDKVAKGERTPDMFIDATPDVPTGGLSVYTNAKRGW